MANRKASRGRVYWRARGGHETRMLEALRRRYAEEGEVPGWFNNLE